MQGVITRLEMYLSPAIYASAHYPAKGRWFVFASIGRLLLDMLLQLAIELDDLHMDLQL